MMNHGSNWEMGWGMGWGMWLIPLLIILAIYFLFRKNAQTTGGGATDSPLDILKKLYAKGEITKAQFEQMKEDI